MYANLTRRDLMKVAAGAVAAGTMFPPSTRHMMKAFAQTVNPTGPYYWVAHVGPGDPYWAVVQRGVQAVGKALGVKTVFEGPAGYSPPKQADMIDAAISAKASGIVTTAADPSVMRGPIERAARAGIPTIFSDTPAPADFPGKFVTGNPVPFVGVDIRPAAARASAKLLPLLPKGAAVVVVNHEPGNRVLELKTNGYIKGIESLDPRVDKLVIGEETTKAVEIMRAYLEKHPDTKAILTLGTLGTHAVIKLLDEMKAPNDKIRVVGSDVDDVTLEAIKRGRVVSTIDLQQFGMGFVPVVLLFLYNAYALDPNDYIGAGGTVDHSNVDTIIKLAKQGFR
jgi:simple sugar transport system substrate-binding protein